MKLNIHSVHAIWNKRERERERERERGVGIMSLYSTHVQVEHERNDNMRKEHLKRVIKI